MTGHAESAVLLDDVERRTTDRTGSPALGGRPAVSLAASTPDAGGRRPPTPQERPDAAAGNGAATQGPGEAGRKVNPALVAVVLLGLLGAYISFFTVRDSEVGQSFGPNAWAVPIAIDLGIAAFTALDLRLTAQRARSMAVRLFPWFLNVTTVYLNAVEQPTWAGRIAHGALPVMWIAAVEATALEVHRRVAGPKVKPDKIPVALWVLAPGTTVLFWRRMRKQGIVSYAQALERDMHRRLVRARFRREFGRWSWRWSAPDEQLELFKMGTLVAVDVVTEVGASPMPARRAQEVERDDSGTETGPNRDGHGGSRDVPDQSRDHRAAGRKPTRRAARAGQLSPRATELLPLAVETAKEHGGHLNRDQLKAGLATRGEGAGGTTLAELMAALRDGGHVR